MASATRLWYRPIRSCELLNGRKTVVTTNAPPTARALRAAVAECAPPLLPLGALRRSRTATSGTLRRAGEKTHDGLCHVRKGIRYCGLSSGADQRGRLTLEQHEGGVAQGHGQPRLLQWVANLQPQKIVARSVRGT